MIGQKTLYSFFSPTPTGKRTTRSPQPAPGSGVTAEDSGDAAVRLAGWRGTEGWRGRGQEHRARRCSDRLGYLRDSKQPRAVGRRHAAALTNGDGARSPLSQSLYSASVPLLAWSNQRRQEARPVLPRKVRVEGLGSGERGNTPAAADWGRRGPGQKSRTSRLLARLGVQNSLARRRPPCRDIHQWERSSAAAKPIGVQRARPAPHVVQSEAEEGGNGFAAKSPRGVPWTRRRAERVPGSARPWASSGRGL